MPARNHCNFIGNLTRDPEVRVTSGGKRVASFSIAVSGRKNKDGDKLEPTYVDLEAWEKTAEIVEKFLAKGDKIAVQAELRIDKWEDKQTGEQRTKPKFSVTDLEMLGGKKGADSAPAPAQEQGEDEAPAPKPTPRKPKPAPKPAIADDDDSDIPF